jgi:glutamate formiminotransferase / 5-formyltetrahydrofolate cyclo-ligase
MTRSLTLYEAVPNFSEGRDASVIDRLADAAAGGGVQVLDRSFDGDHHRVVLTLAGSDPLAGVFAAVAAAVEVIDLRGHIGVHPRRGAADVVPFVPLGSATLEEAALLARALGERIWSELGVPVHFYGAAGTSTLAQVRSPNPPPFDLGDTAHPTAGVVTVGARPPLVAYNLLLAGVSAAEAAAMAARLRESGGGVRGVQALVFAVAGGVQLSMNLTRIAETAPALAREEARRRLPAGGSIVGEEIVGLCPAAAAAGCPAADGFLLEARLASAGAALAASEASRRGSASEELRRLSQRLAEEARALAGLGFADCLEGAERAEALRRVLRAGRLDLTEPDLLLRVAAEGFRVALPAAVVELYPERLAALDRWLAEP